MQWRGGGPEHARSVAPVVLRGALSPVPLPLVCASSNAVYSRDLEWLPDGSEYPDETSCRFASGQKDLQPLDKSGEPLTDEDGEVVQLGPVHKDILLAKMTPGQVQGPFGLSCAECLSSGACTARRSLSSKPIA